MGHSPDGAGGHMYKKMPETMLAKCSEVKALRKAFPAVLQGLYAPEEFEQEHNLEKAAKNEALNERFAKEEKPPKPDYEVVEGDKTIPVDTNS